MQKLKLYKEVREELSERPGIQKDPQDQGKLRKECLGKEYSRQGTRAKTKTESVHSRNRPHRLPRT